MAGELVPGDVPSAERLSLHDHLRNIGHALIEFASGCISPQAVEPLRRIHAMDQSAANGIEAAEIFANSRPNH